MHPHLHAAYAHAVAPRPRRHAHHRVDARPVLASLRRLASGHRAATAAGTARAKARSTRAIPS